MDTSSALMQVVLQAQDNASSTLASFGDTLSNIMQIAAGFDLANVANQMTQAVVGAIGAAEDFQAMSTSLGTVLGNVSDTGESATTSFAGSAGKMSDIAARTADEMRQYAEKIKQLNADLTDTMQGQNVIDAQASMYQQLDDLAQQHADKIASLQQQITDVQTGEQNTLTDMQDSHNNKMADLAEKHAQQMSDAVSQIEKDKLQKQYNEQVQYENDSFERQYNTKKQQLDRDAAQKIQSIQDEIAKENDAYTKKYADEQKKDEENVQKLKEDNDKKLAQYKQELADEEIAHKEHLQRLQEEAASGGGGGGIAPKMQELPINSQFRETAKSAKNLQGFLDQTFSKGTPFQLNDWVEFSKTMSEAGINAQKISPAIENIAAANNVSLSTAGQAIFQGMQGNVKGLSSTLHISAEELHKAGAEFTQAGTVKDKDSFFSALEKIGTQNYAGGVQNYAQTVKGASQEVSNGFQLMEFQILGFNTATGQVTKGGLMDEITKGLQDLFTFMAAHKEDITGFFKGMFDAIKSVGPEVFNGLKSFFQFLSTNGGTIKNALEGAAVGFVAIQAATIGLGIISTIATGFAVLQGVFAAFSVGGVVEGLGVVVAILGGPFTLLIGAVALLVAGLYLAWKTNFLNIQGVTQGVVQWFQSYVLPVLSGIWTGIKFGLTVLWDFLVISFTGWVQAAKGVTGWFGSTFSPFFTGVWDLLKKGWQSFWDNFHKPIEGATGSVLGAVKKMLNGVIDFFDNLIKGANNIGSKVLGYIKIPNIDHFASGTNFAPGGLAVVGEHGPELVNLPRGSQVVPNNQINNSRQQSVTIQNVNINNDMDIDTLARRLTMAFKFNSAII